MTQSADELRALLTAYNQVREAAWPDLHPVMRDRAPFWATASAATLALELQEYVAAASLPTVAVRLFWKLGPALTFGGCNAAFAQDAHLAPDELLGADDYDSRLPWTRQAAKYRADDKAILERGTPDLNILERHTAPDGSVLWVRAAKTPIRTTAGATIGILGMYELLDTETGRRLFAEQQFRLRNP
jgi:PAS domain-containing protein